MRTFILVCLLVGIFPIHVISQVRYKIHGEILNLEGNSGRLKDGDTVNLNFQGSKLVQNSVVLNGKFDFSGSLKEPAVAMLNYKYGGSKFLIDNSEYNLKLKVRQIKDGQFSYLPEIRTDSKYHNLWVHFYQNCIRLNQGKTTLLNEIDKSGDPGAKEALNRNVIANDSLIVQAFRELALNHPDNFAVPYILSDAPDFSYNNYFSIYNTLTERVKNSYQGLKLLQKLEAVKPLAGTESSFAGIEAKEFIGTSLPLIVAINDAGQNITVNDEFAKSKFTLIDFWASWCVPCRTLNIALRANKEEYTKMGLNLVSFSLDNDVANWKKAIKGDKLGWLQVSDLKAEKSPIVKYLKIYAIPSNLLVDGNGIIVARDVHGEQLKALLTRLP